MNKSPFRERNYFYIRVGRNYVVPLLLLLHDHGTFTEIQFHDILRNHLLSLKGNYQSTKLTDEQSTTSKLYCLLDLSFTFKFVSTYPKYCVFIKNPAFVKPSIKTNDKKRNNDIVDVDTNNNNNNNLELKNESPYKKQKNDNNVEPLSKFIPEEIIDLDGDEQDNNNVNSSEKNELIETVNIEEDDGDSEVTTTTKTTNSTSTTAVVEEQEILTDEICEYEGGEYDGLTVTGHTLVIETFSREKYAPIETYIKNKVSEASIDLPDTNPDHSPSTSTTTTTTTKSSKKSKKSKIVNSKSKKTSIDSNNSISSYFFCNSIVSLRQKLMELRKKAASAHILDLDELKVGFVPTMGYLHKGHISLVERARKECGVVVASIFINPTQFSAHEDLSTYPVDLDKDMALLEEAKCDILFLPTVSEMYPTGFSTYVTVEGMSEVLESKSRPGHFRGVATVVAKLLNIVKPHYLYIGEKDAMQCVCIKRLVEDMNFNTEVRVCETVREQGGLAMSSRNSYLTPKERENANIIRQSLESVKKDLSKFQSRDELIKTLTHLIETDPLLKVEYISVSSPTSGHETLVFPLSPGAILSLAVYLNGENRKTRLIDVISL
eukprot:gene2032-2501_t